MRLSTFLALALTACGGASSPINPATPGPCDGHLIVGFFETYPPGESLNLTGQCAGTYKTPSATYPVAFERPSGNTGTVNVTINNTIRPCSFFVNSTVLIVDCFGPVNFYRQ